MPINLTSTGLLFIDDFNRADGAPGSDWSVQAGTVAIVSNRLRASTAGARARTVNYSDRGTIVHQGIARINGGAAGGVTCKHTSGGSFYYIQFQELNKFFLFLFTGGYTAVAGPIAFTYAASSDIPFKFVVAPSSQRFWAGASGSASASGTNTGLNASSGTAGIHLNNTGNVEIDDSTHYASNVVTVTGLPSGWKARISTRVATESGGTASVDLDKDLCPRPLLEILDGSDVVQEDLTTDVWGGDVYEFIAGAQPDPPEILNPEEDDEIDRQLFITLTDVSASVPDPVEYKVEHEPSTGAGWVTIIDWTSTRPVNQLIATGTYAEGTDHRLRAFARAAGVESDETTIVTFTIEHNIAPNKPVAEWIGYSDFRLLGKLDDFSSNAIGAFAVSSEWQVTAEDDEDFSSTIQTIGNFLLDISVGLVGKEGESEPDTLTRDTTFLIRGRWIDEAGLESPWSDPVKGKTSNIGITAHIGTGDIGWGGGLIAGGLAARDLSGNGYHGRYVFVSGGDGSSYLNQGVAIHQPIFPIGRLEDSPLDELTDRGVRFAPDDYDPFTFGGGRAVAWSVNNDNPEVISRDRSDAQDAIPDFGLLIVAIPEYPGTELQTVAVIGESKQPTPINTGRFFSVRILTTGEIRLIVEGTNIGSGQLDIDTGLMAVEGEALVLRISHKYQDVLGVTRSILKINEDIVYNDVPFEWSASLNVIEDIGHFRAGVFFSANIAGTRHFHGIISEFAFWWDEDLDYTDPNDLPIVETVELDEDSIIEAAPTVYWRLNDPQAPEKPSLVQV